MSRDVANWLKSLKSRLGSEKAGRELTTLIDHPDPVVRVLACGIAWGRNADGRQLEEVLPIIKEAMRDLSAIASGCGVLAAIGPAVGDVVPLVWEYLVHPDREISLGAALVILNCCNDNRVLADAASLLDTAAEVGPMARYVASRLRSKSLGET